MRGYWLSRFWKSHSKSIQTESANVDIKRRLLAIELIIAELQEIHGDLMRISPSPAWLISGANFKLKQVVDCLETFLSPEEMYHVYEVRRKKEEKA